MQLEDKKITVEDVEITVKTEQISLHPLAYKIIASHADGESHEQTLTLTNTGSDIDRVPTLQEAQDHLDDIRQSAATKAHKKYLTASLAKNLN